MSLKITAEHLRRSAVVYVRQSSTTQVRENTESQRRQYALADTARTMGFTSVETIDDDLGKSGSGLVERPGFARLVASVCGGGVGGHLRPRDRWRVLLRDHHPGYISWEQFERNQAEMSENAHRIKKPDRKAGRGGRALLTGMLRCGRCGRMLRLNYGGRARRPHRYQCVGQPSRIARKACFSVGGVHVDAAVAERLIEVLTPVAIDAALEASRRTMKSRHDVCAAIERELDEAKYEAALEARRHRAVDPEKRHVARELEARWEAALERARAIELRLVEARDSAHAVSEPDRETLLRLARDLVATWNASGVEMRTKQRLVHVLVREVVVDRDDVARETVLTIHWKGGVHTEVRMARRPPKSDLEARASSAVEVVRKLGGQWPDSTVAMTMNCMRCKNAEGASWNEASVRELRTRLGIAAFDPSVPRPETVSLEEACRRLEIGTDSVRQLIDDGILAATQLMPFAPWQIPASALETDAVRTAAQRVVARRPLNHEALEDRKTLRLPGF